MKQIRVLIADDEPLAIERMQSLLAEIAGVELVGAAASGGEALELMRRLQPELAILDIEMPKVDGFDVVEALLRSESEADDSNPLFCFVTAYPQFALEAFDKGAVDFLCKPVRLSRLEQAIRRARAALEGFEGKARMHELSAQLDDLRRQRNVKDEGSLWVSSRRETVRVNLNSLGWLKAEGEYVRLFVGESSYLLRSSITSFCERFAGEGIVQVHRSFGVNRAYVNALRHSREGMRLVLRDSIEVPVGRHFRKAAQALAATDSRLGESPSA